MGVTSTSNKGATVIAEDLSGNIKKTNNITNIHINNFFIKSITYPPMA
jgi:hypothetical protein